MLPLDPGTCPLGEVARVTAYLAKESSGQCGPCMLGLPAIARSLAALVQGSGGVSALDIARRAAAGVRGRGACAHPDGVFRFVSSALEVFTDDLAAHLLRGTCGRDTRGLLPLSQDGPEQRLTVDWTRCAGHGLCAHLVPELVQLDAQGYPEFLDMPVPPWLTSQAAQAVEMCPALALRLTTTPAPGVSQPARARRAGGASGPAPGAARARPGPAGPGAAAGRGREIEGPVVTEALIARSAALPLRRRIAPPTCRRDDDGAGGGDGHDRLGQHPGRGRAAVRVGPAARPGPRRTPRGCGGRPGSPWR